MAQSYTYEQLLQMGAKPVTATTPPAPKPATPGRQSYTYEQLQQMGATPVEETQPVEGKSLSGFVGNILPSGKKLFTDLYDMVASPVETAKNIKTAVMNPSMIVEGLKQRYGGAEAIANTAYTDPVGAVADVASIFTGVGGAVRGGATLLGRGATLAKAGATAGKLALGTGKAARGLLPGAVAEASTASRTAATLGKIGATAEKIGRQIDPLNVVAKTAGKLANTTVPAVLGKTTGVGSEAIRMAMKAPSEALKAAMRGKVSEMDILSDAKEAFQNIKDKRGAEYQARLAEVSKSTQVMDPRPVFKEAINSMKRFGVQVVPGEGRTIDLDFSRSTIHDVAEQNRVKALVKDLEGWGKQPGDLTPLGFDTLKRRIGDFYSTSGQARAAVTSIKKEVSKALSKVPGYAEMTKGYEQASRLIDEIGDLSLTATNPGTAIRKLQYSLNQNNDYRKMVIEALDEFTDKDLKGQLAGSTLSRVEPRGLAGVGGAGLLVYGAGAGVISPQYLLSLATTSPRAMGEVLVALSAAKRGIAKPVKIASNPAIYRTATGATQAGREGRQQGK